MKKSKEKLLTVSIMLVISWIMASILDFWIAQSFFGDMQLSKFNIIVVMYNTLDTILKGFIF